MGIVKLNKDGKITYCEISWEDCRKIDLTGRKKTYKTEELRTLSYYGSKYKFQNLFFEIYKYCNDTLGCTTFADGFCGSGMLSLLASKAGYKVYMNDTLDLVVNFHCMMKDYQKFYAFMCLVQVWDKWLYGDLDRHKLSELRKELSEAITETKEKYSELEQELIQCKVQNSEKYESLKAEVDLVISEGEKRCKELEGAINAMVSHSRKRYKKLAAEVDSYCLESHRYRGLVSVKKAVVYYLYRHYTFLGRSSYSKSERPAIYNILDLVNVQKYYKNIIRIDNLYYKKFISKFLFDEHTLIMLDPPYFDYTRSDKNAYSKWEFSEKQHRYFLEYISQPGIKAKIVVCGYSTSFYDRRLHKYNLEKGCHWQKVHILKAGSKKRGAREYIWVNWDFKPLEQAFPESFEVIDESLWDYSYRKRKGNEEKAKVEKEELDLEDDNNTLSFSDILFSQLKLSSKKK